MLDKKTKKEITEILAKYIDPKKYKVFIFGSRATGSNLKYSDIDIGIEGNKPIENSIMIELKDEFEESNIPFNVDIVDFSDVSRDFKAEAHKKIKQIIF